MEPHLHYLMIMSYKDRVKKAIENYIEKETKPVKVSVSPRGKPEKEFVKALYSYLIGKGWSIDIVDSAAVYSKSAGMYLNSMARVGMSDIVGNMPNGIAVYIEAKAPGRRSTVRPDQREFLIGKINTNCFAIVCDSIGYFDMAFEAWSSAVSKKAFLLKELPELSSKWTDEGPLF